MSSFFKSKSFRSFQRIFPILLLMPYVGYVIYDRLEFHEERRLENKRKKKLEIEWELEDSKNDN